MKKNKAIFVLLIFVTTLISFAGCAANIDPTQFTLLCAGLSKENIIDLLGTPSAESEAEDETLVLTYNISDDSGDSFLKGKDRTIKCYLDDGKLYCWDIKGQFDNIDAVIDYAKDVYTKFSEEYTDLKNSDYIYSGDYSTQYYFNATTGESGYCGNIDVSVGHNNSNTQVLHIRNDRILSNYSEEISATSTDSANKDIDIIRAKNDTIAKDDTDLECDHIWEDATCDKPKTCILCGETEGKAKGHDWKEADCNNPKTCKKCVKTESKKKGHKWTAATLHSPKTCSVCGKTEGEALSYKFIGNGTVTTDDGGLNMRKGASTDDDVITLMPQYASLKVYDCNIDGWYYVEYDGECGYSCADYITLDSSKPSSSTTDAPKEYPQSTVESYEEYIIDTPSETISPKTESTKEEKQYNSIDDLKKKFDDQVKKLYKDKSNIKFKSELVNDYYNVNCTVSTDYIIDLVFHSDDYKKKLESLKKLNKEMKKLLDSSGFSEYHVCFNYVPDKTIYSADKEELDVLAIIRDGELLYDFSKYV